MKEQIEVTISFNDESAIIDCKHKDAHLLTVQSNAMISDILQDLPEAITWYVKLARTGDYQGMPKIFGLVY